MSEDNGPILVATMAEVGKLVSDLAAMEKDRERWRRALNDCTPGGSEFVGDPEYCKKYVLSRRETLWETAKKNFLGYKNLREAMDKVVPVLRLVRNGAEGKEIQTLARDVIDLLEGLDVGRGKQVAEGPGPQTAPPNLARKEPD